MSHDLEQTNVGTPNQKTSFYSVREPAWHKLGYISNKYLPVAEVLEHAGLNWTVNLQEVYDKDCNTIPGFFGTTRSTDGKTLGIVRGRYVPVQNRELLNYTESVLGTDYRQDTERGIETAGALNGGREVFALAKIDKALYIAGEEIDQYFLMLNSHDGSKTLRAIVTPVRVVCRNTLNAALQGTKRSFAIRHTAGYENQITQGQRSLGLIKHYYESFAVFAENLVKQKFSETQFEALAKNLYPIKPDATKREEKSVMDLRDQLVRCYNADDLNNIRGTAWAAFNAVADQNDHYAKFNASPNDLNRKFEKIFRQSFEKTELKDHALQLILAAA